MAAILNPAQRADREERAWRLRVAGKTEHEIASELGMSQPGVSRLLDRVEQRVLREHKTLVLRLKAREHGVLELVRREALAGYERSRRQAGSSTTTVSSDADGKGAGGRLVKKTEDRDGDPAWLAVILQTHDRVAALWGLQSPKRVEVAREPDPMEQLSQAELLIELEKELDEERRKLLGGSEAREGATL